MTTRYLLTRHGLFSTRLPVQEYLIYEGNVFLEITSLYKIEISLQKAII